MMDAWHTELWDVGAFMGGLGILIMAGLEIVKYVDRNPRRIIWGRPPGTYEVDMDEEG